ncbi:armadillo-type protein [Mycena maculata]|uniref:Armadillo-type protein n=1 Tax=Mycena maculata TaxID=230809 RepID=A0AAD7J8X2_9AGAR|nr:armadillo-type protein [Mycena maculata]
MELLVNSKDEETRVAMIHTISSLAAEDEFCRRSNEFPKVVRQISLLLSDQQTEIRKATLQTFLVISKQDTFAQIVNDSLPVLVEIVHRDDTESFEDDEDEFRIAVLQVLSDLANKEVFRDTISAKISRDYILAAKDEDWSTRVAGLNLMSCLGVKDPLKNAVKQIMPDIIDTLHNDENKSIRMAGVQFLSIPVVKEISHDALNNLVPTLVDLLSDSEEDVRVAVLKTLSDLAKQDVFREAINRALPALLDALRRGDWKTRVAALDTWSGLAQDGTFRELVNKAAPKIAACLKDPDDDVRIAALGTFSQFSKDEAFRIAVTEAAPNILSELDNEDWETRVCVLQTFRKFAENDAFGDIINSFIPKIVDSLKDGDEDVQFEGLDVLLTLIQQDIYHGSIQGTLQASGISVVVDLMSDRHKHVKIGALRLFPKVILLDRSLDPESKGLSCIINRLSDDKDVCIATLEGLSELVLQDMPLTPNLIAALPKIIRLLKPGNTDNYVCSAILRTLSAFIARDECVETITAAVPGIFSIFTDTKEDDCRNAATEVFLTLASQEASPSAHYVVLPYITSTLTHETPSVRVASLKVLSKLVGQDLLDLGPANVSNIISLLEDPEEDVRIAAIQMTVLLRTLQPEILKDEQKFHSVIHTAWRNVLADVESAKPSTFIAAFDKLPQLAEYACLMEDSQFPGVGPPIFAALKDSTHDVHLCGLRALSKLAENNRFRTGLVRAVPKVTALLANKRTDIRVQTLKNLHNLAGYPEFRQRIVQDVGDIIPTLKDRDPEVRVAGLKVLLALAQGERIPDRIKLTTPHLLTLLQSQSTRKDAVALITCLAGDKTLRADLLAKILPLLRGQGTQMLSWGHLLLIKSLFEHNKLESEASDLQFMLCLMTSKQHEIQDFVLKFMTTTIQRYLETWMAASVFPPRLSSFLGICAAEELILLGSSEGSSEN